MNVEYLCLKTEQFMNHDLKRLRNVKEYSYFIHDVASVSIHQMEGMAEGMGKD